TLRAVPQSRVTPRRPALPARDRGSRRTPHPAARSAGWGVSVFRRGPRSAPGGGGEPAGVLGPGGGGVPGVGAAVAGDVGDEVVVPDELVRVVHRLERPALA